MTMTPERLAELDAVHAKATAGGWAYKPQDYDDWGTIRAAPDSEGRAYIVAVSRGDGQQDHKVHRELGTDPYEPNGRAIVALHNAYPDLRAHIDAQAATIAGLAADAARYRWLRDASVPPHNFYISTPDEFAGTRYKPQDVDDYIDAARAALTGAA